MVNTRAAHQADDLDSLLIEHGATPLSFPCIAIATPVAGRPLDEALHDLMTGRFAWVLFTSVNTVESVASRLGVADRQRLPVAAARPRHGAPDALIQFKVAAVGAVTAAAIRDRLGWPVTFVPEEKTAMALGRSLPIVDDGEVLLPQSALAGPGLAAILRGRGATVVEVVAYVTTTGSGGVDLASLLALDAVDAVCLTSGSTARGLTERLGGTFGLDRVRVACIGPETADAARGLGIRVAVVPVSPTARGMVESLADSFAEDER